MDSTKLKAIIVAILALFSALYLGITAATAQFETIAWVVGGLVLSTCLLLGRRIWLLIPFLGSINLALMIPGTPTTMLIAQLLVLSFCTLMFLARKLPIQMRFTEIEWWILILLACVAQVYARNPVGVSLFGGEQIGGKAYVLFCVSLCTALLLCCIKVPSSQMKTAMKLSILGGFINLSLGALGALIPSIGIWLGTTSANAGDPEKQRLAVDSMKAGRLELVRTFAQTAALTVSSYRSPLIACFSIRWAPLIVISFVFAMLSGYRNVVAAVGMTYLVGLYYRGGIAQLMIAGLCAMLGLGALAVTNSIVPLPPNIQRSLSFLPGTWDEEYILDSRGSSNWRFEMWKEVLTTDRWIQNKFLGDGLGFSLREMKIQEQLNAEKRTNWTGSSGFDLAREYVMINGDYHSGPVSAVRTIGYTGLFVMLLFQIRILIRAHRQILRSKGTEWFPVTLFFCIPMIWFPFFFTFIFGGFKGDVVVILMNAGMLRLLENNLPLPAYMPARSHPSLLQSKQTAVARQPA